MPATVVQNPPAQPESKSAKKKKAKAAAAASAPERTASPAPSGTPEKPSSVVGGTEAGENVYIQLLKKYALCTLAPCPNWPDVANI